MSPNPLTPSQQYNILKSRLSSHHVTKPSLLTVQQLKSALSEAYVKLPSSGRQKKSYYVELYQEVMRRGSQRGGVSGTAAGTTTARNAPNNAFQQKGRKKISTTSSSSRKRKRSSSPDASRKMATATPSPHLSAPKAKSPNPFQLSPQTRKKRRLMRSQQNGQEKSQTNASRGPSNMQPSTTKALSAHTEQLSELSFQEQAVKSPPKKAAYRTSSHQRGTKARGTTFKRAAKSGLATRQPPQHQFVSQSLFKPKSRTPVVKKESPSDDIVKKEELKSSPSHVTLTKEVPSYSEKIRRRLSKESVPPQHKQTADSLKKALKPPTFRRHPKKKDSSSFSEKTQSLCSKFLNFFFIVLIMLAIAGASFALLQFYQQHYHKSEDTLRLPASGSRYCDTEPPYEITQDCEPCPEHGYCSNGELQACDPAYEIRDGICVENEEIATQAMNLIDYVKPILASHRGNYECYRNHPQCEEQYSSKGIPLSTLRTRLEKEFLLTHQGQLDEEQFDAVYQRFKSLVEKYPFELKKDFRDDIELPEGAHESHHIDEDSVKMLYSERISKPLSCVLHEFYAAHKLYFISFFVIVLVSLLAKTWLTKKRRQREYHEEIKSLVLNRLREDKSCVVVHLRDEFKEHHKIDDKVWEHVVDRVQRDSRILEDVDAYNSEIWVWNSKERATSEKGQE